MPPPTPKKGRMPCPAAVVVPQRKPSSSPNASRMAFIVPPPELTGIPRTPRPYVAGGAAARAFRMNLRTPLARINLRPLGSGIDHPFGSDPRPFTSRRYAHNEHAAEEARARRSRDQHHPDMARARRSIPRPDEGLSQGRTGARA